MRFDAVPVVDFGGQYCHLIVRRVREFGVYSEILPQDISAEGIRALEGKYNLRGLILSGGPSSATEAGAPSCDPAIFGLSKPILGICYGHQLIAKLFGGRVERLGAGEFGIAYARIKRPKGILRGLKGRERVWMSHRDSVVEAPKGFEVLAHTKDCPVASFGSFKRKLFGVQWHPEVIHTDSGRTVIKNFLFHICGCEPNWGLGDFVGKAVEYVRGAVGDGRAIIALSGGIDSSTAAVLASRALGKRLTAVFVDHGFMREGEPEAIRRAFERFDIELVVREERDRFLRRLRGIADPEAKRRAIGEEFVRVFEEVAREKGAKYLVQGTIYPDRIESGSSRHSDKIKTHHNVGGLPLSMEFEGIVEPLKDLYKDEVREVAKGLGLPEEFVRRQPFPGPGLAVRIIGEVTEEKLEALRRADAIVREEFESKGLGEYLWQYFAVLTDTKSTGVKGDSRAYGYVVAIRAVESADAMTAKFAKIPYGVLERISTRIANEVPEVTRVVYDITHKPPATIEWE
jgi:GMP synthase (glutamine-hydrolysing)